MFSEIQFIEYGKGNIHMGKTNLWTREFIDMGLTNLFYFMSQYILIASLPIYMAEEMGGGQWEAGMAMTFFQIGTVSARPFAGRIIDQANKQKLLLGVSALFFLVMIAFHFADSLDMIFGLRLVHGILFALGTTASATMASMILPPARKGEGIGYFAVSGNLAMVIGPMVGLLVIQYFGSAVLFSSLGILAVLALAAGNGKKLPEEVILPGSRKRARFTVSSFLDKNALPAVGMSTFVFFAYGGVLTFIPMYTQSMDLTGYTSLFFMVFALIIVVTRPLVGYVFDHNGPDFTVYPGFLSFAIGFVLFSMVEGPVLLLVSAAFLGLGFGALAPAAQTIAIQSAPPSRTGVATSTYFWSLDIAVGLSATILGALAMVLGYRYMYGVVSTAVVILGTAYYALARKKGWIRTGR